MWKKSWWPVELIVIIGIFGISLQMIRFSGFSYFNYLISAQAIILIGYTAFLIFAIFRINQTSKNSNHSVQYYFKNKFLPKDIWLVLLILTIAGTYKFLIKIKFVHIFTIGGALSPIGHLTSFQSWSLISLMFISFPIGVIAEELYFRCYLFEIQDARFKNYTWLINGFSWSIYHVFSATNFIAILPTCLMYSYIYQKRRNIWITISAHLISNSFAFYSVLKYLTLI